MGALSGLSKICRVDPVWGFLLGAVLAHAVPVFPSPPVAILMLSAVGLLIGVCRRLGWWAVGAGTALMLLGFAWVWTATAWRLQGQWPASLAQRQLLVAGVLVAPAEPTARGVRVHLQLDQADGQAVSHRVRLNWYHPPAQLQPGQRWQLRAKLFSPWGMANPGGRDLQRWLFRHNIVATGYVIDAPPERPLAAADNRLLADAGGLAGALTRFRLQLAEDIAQLLGQRAVSAPGRLRALVCRPVPGLCAHWPADGASTALIVGLAVGLRDRLSDTQWQVLRDTGTSHLMAISGLHVGLVAGLGLLAGRRLWARCPGLGRRVAPIDAGWVAGLATGAGYAALAGFALPTQRALIMLAVLIGARLLRRHTRAPHILGCAAALVLLVDPFAPLSGGFWLSFGAVALLLWQARYAHAGSWRARLLAAARVQWALSIGMLALVVGLFGYASGIAPLANFLVIPMFALLVVPLVLVGVVLALPGAAWTSAPAGVVMGLAGACLDLLMAALAYLATLPGATVALTLSTPALVLAQVGCLLLIAPLPAQAAAAAAEGASVAWQSSPVRHLLLPPLTGWRRWLALRSAGMLLLLAGVGWSPQAPEHGAVRMTVLDVGQGLAAVIQTARHALVFDTGPRHRSGSDAGQLAVLPYLRWAGVARPDMIMVSHADNDHRGGLRSVREVFADVPVYAGEPMADERPCASLPAWDWDGVEFSVLHPPPHAGWEGNNASCVLQISTSHTTLLLPGDIEADAEAAVLASHPHLQADVMVAAHHGSATSSTHAWVAAMRAQLVIYPAARGNRWGFPRSQVARRWAASGADAVQTGLHGAITVQVAADGQISVRKYRESHRRHWRAPAE